MYYQLEVLHFLFFLMLLKSLYDLKMRAKKGIELSRYLAKSAKFLEQDIFLAYLRDRLWLRWQLWLLVISNSVHQDILIFGIIYTTLLGSLIEIDLKFYCSIVKAEKLGKVFGSC